MFEFYAPFYGWAPVRSMDDERLLKNTYIPMRESKEEEKMDISKMTKEDALKAIEELKAYVEQCEEKEIPEMPRHGDYNVHIVVPNQPFHPYISWNGSFENQESSDLYNILSFELANLVYAREYLKVESLHADQDANDVYGLVYNVYSGCYKVNHYGCVDPCEDEILWLFKDYKDAEKVCDYMNKYVKDVKRNMY